MERKNIKLEETQGYALACTIKPFFDSKMKLSDVNETINDFGKSINNAFLRDKSSKIQALKELVEKTILFSKGEKVELNGCFYQKGINENSFYKEVENIKNKY